MLKLVATAFTLAAAACSPPANETATSDMQMMNAAEGSDASVVAGAGLVTAIDTSDGTVSLDHEPIAAIDWPAMSMQFTVEDPSLLQGIAVGDRVSFELKGRTETSVITALRRH